MKRIVAVLISLVLLMANIAAGQKKSGKYPAELSGSVLAAHVSFLASTDLGGRQNGEAELDIAATYIESQLRLMGLKPVNGSSYRQPYAVSRKSLNSAKTKAELINGSDTLQIKPGLAQILPTGPSDFVVEGGLVFAGYGIKADKYSYNDLEGISTEGKIILVMERAPMNEDGNMGLFTEQSWMSEMSFQMKLTTLLYSKAKAILFVADPKSGHKTVDESHPGLAGYLKTTIKLRDDKNDRMNNPFMSAMPKIMFIDREMADQLLAPSGKDLVSLQNGIDASMKPASFEVSNYSLRITEVSETKDLILNNVAAIIEGSDPVLKSEVLIFSGHYDHVGRSGNSVNTGADDNASGCAALLSMAGAFSELKKKPSRSVMFLFFSGEEIGLFGSRSYVDNPLLPLDKTVADINIDMIGRVRSVADSSSQTPMSSSDSVFIITDNQSSELLKIASAVDSKNPLGFDYSLSARNHPLQLYSRSDHYNFVQKDIATLFFTTGLHTDYHTPRDTFQKLDFVKMEKVTRAIFDIGFELASRKERITLDNPYSSWGKGK